jgi:hypothetical protein
MLAGGTEDKEHAMSQKLDTSPAVIGIDIGKNSFHIVGQNSPPALEVRLRPYRAGNLTNRGRSSHWGTEQATSGP